MRHPNTQEGLTPEDIQATFDKYVHEARRLQKLYADRIRIFVGLETDMCRPEWLQDIQQTVERYQLDYMVGSVHHVREKPIDYDEEGYDAAEAFCGGTEQLFIDYFTQVGDMVEALRPTIVGHFDLIRLFRQQQPLIAPILAAIERAIDAIVRHNCLVEINASALRKELMAPYPHFDILQVGRGMLMISAAERREVHDGDTNY